LGVRCCTRLGPAVHTPECDSITRKWPEVRLLAVTPTARGRGVGVALMEECVLRARGWGDHAHASHDRLNASSRAAVHARGFVRAPELDFSPGPRLS